MKLTAGQCLELIEKPVNKTELQLAIKQEEGLRLHIEPIQTVSSMPESYRGFLSWIQSFLPADKFKRFEILCNRLPLKTVEETAKIFTELKKFFEAPDKVNKFQFTAPDLEQDFYSYLETNLDDENFWTNQGFKALQTGINSFLIVDLPAVQTTERPEPYFYICPVKNVHTVLLNDKSGVVEYIAICQNDGSIVFIDELAYRRFIKPENEDWKLADNGEAFHSFYDAAGRVVSGLGYVPACSSWEGAVERSAGINKIGPLTRSLSKLDWLLFKIISQDYFETYGSYPVVVRYKDACRYKDADNNGCENGFINYSELQNDGLTYKNCQKPCPVCSKSGLIGAGSELTADPPKDGSDVDLMKNPLAFIEPSTGLLEFGVDKVEKLKREIFLNVVGEANEATKEAINEKQVVSQYESRESILNEIRDQFDSSRKFALDTVARLRYDSRYYVGSSIFGGSDYFLTSVDDLSKRYEESKKRGLPAYLVASIRQSLQRTMFRNDPRNEQRNQILGALYPYPDLTLGEMKAAGLELADPESFILKADFNNLVAKFERTNGNLVDFGSLLAFDKKIQIIQTKLLDYVKAKRPIERPQPEPGSA